jgi:acetolactate synthase-1/2/3 large subunit
MAGHRNPAGAAGRARAGCAGPIGRHRAIVAVPRDGKEIRMMTVATAPASNLRQGGRLLVDQLLIHGVDLAFCVPGESFLAALDAMHDAADRLRLVTCRHEATASHMAEAYGKLTGRPGILFVTRGPGAAHAMVGVHTAFQDSTPMILFVGQIERATREREAFQEIDIKAMFGHTAKWAAEIDDAARIPELVSRAFHLAVSGRPGPVVLGLPEDMLLDRTDAPDAARYQVVRPAPAPAQIARMRAMLAGARRPIVILGGGGWSQQAVDDIRAFVEASNLPVAASFRCNDLLDNDHPCYIGDCGSGGPPALARRIREECDLLLVVGARLGEFSTHGYTTVVPPRPRQRLIHVHADAGELGRVYQGDLLIATGMDAFAAAARALAPIDRRPWDAWTRAARADYEANQTPGPCPGSFDYGQAMLQFSRAAPADAVITVDSGNFSGWLQRFYRVRRFRGMLAPTNGTMGYAIPAALAAKLAEPQRPAIAWVGDGGFMMSGHELATAALYGAAIVVVCVNNAGYGTIRMHQARTFPGRYPATALRNPDFAAYARLFGGYGEVVERTGQFLPAFDRALKAGVPAVLELRLDPEAVSTRVTLSELAEATRAGRPILAR